jgi:hypothetical protein
MNTCSENIHGWPGVRLSAADVSIGLTPDIGGRILSLTYCGEELLYVHLPEAGRVFDLSPQSDLKAFKEQFGFRIFGGDKTWVAPESEWLAKIPPLDLDVGRYRLEQLDGWAVLTSLVCRETGLQIIRRVRLEYDGTIRLQEEFHNATDRPILKGIWNVTQVRKPFDVFLPADEGAIRSYYCEDPTLPHPGQEVEYDGGWAKVPCRSSVCFKFGGMLREGRLVLLRPAANGVIFFAREFEYDPDARYAHRSAVEVFNSAQFAYGEVEVHAPWVTVPHRGFISFRQTWLLGATTRAVVPSRLAESIFSKSR